MRLNQIQITPEAGDCEKKMADDFQLCFVIRFYSVVLLVLWLAW